MPGREQREIFLHMNRQEPAEVERSLHTRQNMRTSLLFSECVGQRQ